MALRYTQAFGLRDNPFGPTLRFGQVPPVLTQDLEKRPLLVHKDKRLDDLYCEVIPSFKSACDNLETLLEAADYSKDPKSRGVASFLVCIEGDRGAGKTTLASRMLELVLERTPDGDPPWHVVELFLKSHMQTATDQAAALSALEESAVKADAPYVCILADDLLADAYPALTQLYDSLRDKCTLFMVFTSYDARMTEQVNKSMHSVEHFRIAPLSPDDAIAYIASRYKVYRIPDANGIAALPLFPFDEKDIRAAVKVKTFDAAATTGPVNLRMIASILAVSLRRRLQEMAQSHPNFDVSTATAEQLAEFVIKVAQSYKLVVRT